MVTRTRGFAVAIALTLLLASGTALAKGEFFLHDDESYWWYFGDDRLYEVLLPSRPIYTVEQNVFGEKSLQIPLHENGPFIVVASFPGDRTARDTARDAVTDRWRHVLSDERVRENRTIRTGTGLDAQFIVIEGRASTGRSGMVRAVFFTKNDHNAYLVWVGDAREYSGAYQNHWIEAVNTFSWLR